MSAATHIWIGTSGWSYPDWAGIVYPRHRPRGFHPLTFLAQHFNAVEINSSFYSVPRPEHTADWVLRVPEGFRFAVKLTRDFTHDRGGFPPSKMARAFRDALQPIADARKLGPLLVQFPWSFHYGTRAIERLQRITECFADVQRVIEVRHASWSIDAARAALARFGGVCNIDQPQLNECLAPSAHVVGPAAYVRLHGRNAAMWFAEGVPAFERYNYLYSETEIAEWIDRLRAIATQAEELFVFANNHYRGQGVANALELRALLSNARVRVPDTMLAAFPRLGRIAAPPDQPTLFDASGT